MKTGHFDPEDTGCIQKMRTTGGLVAGPVLVDCFAKVKYPITVCSFTYDAEKHTTNLLNDFQSDQIALLVCSCLKSTWAVAQLEQEHLMAMQVKV